MVTDTAKEAMWYLTKQQEVSQSTLGQPLFSLQSIEALPPWVKIAAVMMLIYLIYKWLS